MVTGIRLLLIRHGESVSGAEGRYAGHLDSPLAPADGGRWPRCDPAS